MQTVQLKLLEVNPRITQGDLATIVTNFWQRDIPIHVELNHTSVGLLADLWTTGDKLWGTVVVQENWYLGSLIRDLIVSAAIDPTEMRLLGVILLRPAPVETTIKPELSFDEQWLREAARIEEAAGCDIAADLNRFISLEN